MLVCIDVSFLFYLVLGTHAPSAKIKTLPQKPEVIATDLTNTRRTTMETSDETRTERGKQKSTESDIQNAQKHEHFVQRNIPNYVILTSFTTKSHDTSQ